MAVNPDLIYRVGGLQTRNGAGRKRVNIGKNYIELGVVVGGLGVMEVDGGVQTGPSSEVELNFAFSFRVYNQVESTVLSDKSL
jgi:hypothetical protein